MATVAGFLAKKLDVDLYQRQQHSIDEDFNDKFIKLRSQLRDTQSKLSSCESDIRTSRLEVNRFKVDLADKVNLEESQRIWEHFQNYCEYKELKVLYNKVLPEMAKYEKNMEEHRMEIGRFQEVVSRFDEVLANKASRLDVWDLETQLRRDYLSNKLLDKFERQNNQMVESLTAR